ncbi:hypothetical protein ACFOHK_14795 [Falsigemmobacter intermedius]|uniref:hypothetical protein n=1 Tax=Falsigemmobacter intermedius TaxID=1553448 RepID=UPI001F4FCAAD|nr:hypothetical protein [Falsigemmobacter intermedius]
MSAADPFRGLDPEAGERVLAEFRPDKAAYWRSHLVIAVAGGVIAGLVLIVMANPDPWVGPVAAFAALALRGWYLQSEVLGMIWTLTDRRLILPGGRVFRLNRITKVRKFLSDVQIVTLDGDKHLIRYPADAGAVVDVLQAAGAGR